MNKRLLLGLFLIITPVLYASEYTEEDAKARSAAINADAELAVSLTHEEIEGTCDQKAERIAVLKAAFNGCKGPKDMLTQEQLGCFPTDLGDHIASFLVGDRFKCKLVARNILKMIPSMVDLGIGIVALDAVRMRLNHGKLSCVYNTYENVATNTERTLNEKQRDIIKNRNSFLVYRNTRGNLVYKMHPEAIQQLLRLSEDQLNYLIWFYDGCKEERDRRNKFTIADIRQDIDNPSQKELKRTPEQIAIHDSLPENIRSCIESNCERSSCTFRAPVAAAVTTEEAGE